MDKRFALGVSWTPILPYAVAHGNIVQTETTVTRTYLYIAVTHKTADEMAVRARESGIVINSPKYE